MRVFILATCRKPELLPMATLVFDSLHVGFPFADVTVFVNDIVHEHTEAVEATIHAKCQKAELRRVKTIHHEWIEDLILTESNPFFLVDTDVIFYSNFERFPAPDAALSGWRIPEWNDAFSGCITRARLHPSLLYVHPKKVMEGLTKVRNAVPAGPFTPYANVFYPLVVPFKGKSYFYDTLSLLYHAIGGQPFTDQQKNAYCHFNFGTIPDLVLPRLPEHEARAMEERRKLILTIPSSGFGAWREQEEYYANHPA